jgi:hypothetical protein
MLDPSCSWPRNLRPGERLELDWCHASELEIRIEDQRLEHLLVHVVLPYSNWERTRVCYSESFLSLKRGLQSERLSNPTSSMSNDVFLAQILGHKGQSANPDASTLC